MLPGDESVCEDSHTEHMQFASAAVSTEVFCNLISQLLVLDTRYLIVKVKTPAGNLEYQISVQNTSQLATSLATDTQYFILQQKCRLYIFTYITSIFRVDGSILAGVFLSSFIVLCLGLHIPPMQRVAAYQQLGPQTALVQLVVPSQQWLHSKITTLEEAATETGRFSAPLGFT